MLRQDLVGHPLLRQYFFAQLGYPLELCLTLLKGTDLIPLIPIAGLWDAVISMLRFYSDAELFELTKDLPDDFVWEYREINASLGLPLTIFTGIPK